MQVHALDVPRLIAPTCSSRNRTENRKIKKKIKITKSISEDLNALPNERDYKLRL